jgi:NADPH2:quinone reductase
MKAVTFAEFGGPEVLRITEKPDPVPTANEVAVAVSAAAINPTDLLTLSGSRASMMKELNPPYTAGMDFSGHVVAVGENVTSVRVGQPVIGVASPRRAAGGAHAQIVSVPAASVAPVGEGSDLTAAATVPMNALTGVLSLELLGLRPGQSLLVTGATGMLGSLSVELALLDDLDVVVNGADADRDFLSGLGAKMILPRDEGLHDALRQAYPDGVDGVIDGALIGQTISPLIRDGGGLISPRVSYRIEDSRLKVQYVQVTQGLEDEEKMHRIGRLLEEGKLTPRLAPEGVFSFANAASAYAMAQRGGFRGRVVLTFTE